MSGDAETLAEQEKRVKRLLGWATVLALVAVAVMGLDVMIKNAILDQAKESQTWIDRLREDVKHGAKAAGTDQPGRLVRDHLDDLGDVRAGTSAEPRPDARM